MRRVSFALLLAALAMIPASTARADIALGQPGPNFTKVALGGGSVSLADYPGKVVVLVLFGYDCPFCLANAPSVQQNIADYYDQMYPGQVQVIGADLWNGTVGQVSSFQQQTGATYPLLLNGALATGGNLSTLYGPYDNFLVLNKQGVVRYHAALKWPHGNRYHLDEIRGSVDSLVMQTAGVGDLASRALALAAAPNPARGPLAILLTLPADENQVRVAVFDLNGRQTAILLDAPAPAGIRRLVWDARDRSGARVPPGVYLIAAEVGSARLTRRVVVVR